MLSDELPTRTPSMERRELGMLTLQLRQAVSEAEAAEAESAADAIDLEAARQQMAAKLEPMLAARRKVLDDELAAARAAADTTVAKARRAAAVMVAQAARTVEPEPEAVAEAEPVVEPEPEVEVEEVAELEQVADVEPEVEEVAELEPELEPEPDLLIATEPVVEPVLPADDPWAMWARPTDDVHADDGLEPEVRALATPAEPQITVVNTPNIIVDAEAFARVFATVLAEARAGQPTVAPEYLAALQAQAQLVAPAAQKAPVKQGFWANAKHLDVLLLGLGAAIVLGILAAWLV